MKRDREEGEIETDTANYLMLLSKVGESETIKSSPNRVFTCKTCNRQFPSFQALGGHRASHKKPRLMGSDVSHEQNSPAKPKTHECSICGLEFAIGQALGGHMRRHRDNKGGSERNLVAHVLPQAPLRLLKRSVSSKRVFGLDLNLTPVENDLKLQLMSTPIGIF